MEVIFEHYPFKIKKEHTQRYIWDIVRKKFVFLSPEEWVRQHIIWYLIKTTNYPKTLIQVEKQIIINKMSKRVDIVAYNKAANPLLIVECKSRNTGLNQLVLEQISMYNIALKTPYLWISNGQKNHFFRWSKAKNIYEVVHSMPVWSSII